MTRDAGGRTTEGTTTMPRATKGTVSAVLSGTLLAAGMAVAFAPTASAEVGGYCPITTATYTPGNQSGTVNFTANPCNRPVRAHIGCAQLGQTGVAYWRNGNIIAGTGSSKGVCDPPFDSPIVGDYQYLVNGIWYEMRAGGTTWT